MKQNKYDDPDFFLEYSKMQRSKEGLTAAGEWATFRDVLPDLKDKRVLDLGCGYGWHCRFAAEQGASEVIGIDISEKMINRARELTTQENVSYAAVALEDYQAPSDSFDVVLSSLALHYIADLAATFATVAKLLRIGGSFCYSTEHPIFTSRSEQDWHYNTNGEAVHWPIDGYFNEGSRNTNFLGTAIVKYHRTIQSHFEALRLSGFRVERLLEPVPSTEDIKKNGWENELRRPMMLIMKATKT